MGTLDILSPITRMLPEVAPPKVPPSIKERLMWTGIALFAFFVMYNVLAVGVDPRQQTRDFLQVVTASNLGTLLTIGIGPIVLASIFLQLFAGAKIISVNMQNPEEKANFQAAQKLLAIILCVIEAAIFVFSARGLVIESPLFGSLMATQIFVILQVAIGSMILLYLDEVVAKHGIGSGISLFIAAGVSFSVIGGVLNLIEGENGVLAAFAQGGAEALPMGIVALAPLFFTIIVFLVVVYSEGIKVEIPLAFDRARGLGSRFPIKFLYVSNIPVILAAALLLNLQFFATSLEGQHLCIGGEFSNVTLDPQKVCGTGMNLVPYFGYVSGGQLHDGLLYMISPIYKPINQEYGTYVRLLVSGTTPVFGIPEILHIFVYIVFMMGLCIIFGQFWVETTNMNAHAVAEQLDSAGLQVPGYRRDPRIIEKMLERYIPPITILSSAFVGLLASTADLTGALGTGTGILLTVGILARLYEDLERQSVFDSYSMLSGIVGKK